MECMRSMKAARGSVNATLEESSASESSMSMSQSASSPGQSVSIWGSLNV